MIIPLKASFMSLLAASVTLSTFALFFYITITSLCPHPLPMAMLSHSFSSNHCIYHTLQLYLYSPPPPPHFLCVQNKSCLDTSQQNHYHGGIAVLQCKAWCISIQTVSHADLPFSTYDIEVVISSRCTCLTCRCYTVW